jgi:hypothetical protein
MSAPEPSSPGPGQEAERPAEEGNTEEEQDDELFTREGIDGLADPELGGWVFETLQKLQPGVEISVGSMQAISNLLDGVTVAVLEEAKRISQGGAEPAAEGAPAAAPATRPKGREPPLTSLDIHKALKRLLPSGGEPGERLRPYLPTVTKHAWHLDKQSLKGVKRQKLVDEAAAQSRQAAACPAAGARLPENSGPGNAAPL